MHVRRITRQEHESFLATTHEPVSFLQCPGWGEVKAAWEAESIGWIERDGTITGVALVLYRHVPGTRRSLAYLPEGPVLDWNAPDLPARLEALLTYLSARGAFSVKMSPPLAARHWDAKTVRRGAALEPAHRLDDLPADFVEPTADRVALQLRRLGWQRSEQTGGAFGGVQPRFIFEVPLAGLTWDEVQAGFDSAWRRNVRRAQASGVTVREGSAEDLPEFHRLLLVTGERDGFSSRSLPYFQKQWRSLNADQPGRMRLYLAEYQGDVLAAGTMLVVNDHVWYQSGASANEHRDVRAANALQLHMMGVAYAMGAVVYDMRGISDTLEPTAGMYGLTRFKLGTGGRATEYLGEWDFALRPALHRMFELYMSGRHDRSSAVAA